MARSLSGFAYGTLALLAVTTACAPRARSPGPTALSGPPGPAVDRATHGRAVDFAGPAATNTSSGKPPASALPTVAAVEHVWRGAQALGTDGPLVVEAAAPDGSWVAYCQARIDTDRDGKVSVSFSPTGDLIGDSLERYFSFGEIERVHSELLASDPSGRWVILSENGKTELVDLKTSVEVDLEALGADVASSSALYLPHRSLAFHPTLPFFAYTRSTPAGLTAVLRNLETNAELAVELGAGALSRLEFSAAGDALVAQIAPLDANKKGRPELPIPLKRAQSTCQAFAPTPKFPAWVEASSELVARVSSVSFEPMLTATPFTEVLGLIAPLGGGWLVRDTDKSLWLVRGKRRQVVAPARCAGVVWHVDSGRGAVVFACAGKNAVALSQLQIYRAGAVSKLGVELRPLGRDRWLRPERLVPLYPGALSFLLDMEKGSAVPLLPDDGIVTVDEEQALIWRKNRLLRFSGLTQETVDLGVEVEPLAYVVQNRGIAVVSPYVVDLKREQPLGKISGRPLVVADDGHVLIAKGQQASADSLATGPLGWVSPN